MGPAPDYALPRAPHSDDYSLFLGLTKRIGSDPGHLDMREMRNFRRFVGRFLRRHFKPLDPDTDFSFETWIKGTKYPLWRKEQLATTYSEWNGILLPRHKYCKCFIKDEPYPAFKHPRQIFSRSDTFKCLFGPIVAQVENVIFKHPSFIKKVPNPERPQHMMDTFENFPGEFYSTDYTSYEASFRPELMRACEYQMFKYILQSCPIAKAQMKKCKRVILGMNTCTFKKWKVNIRAKRMSGEMDTSLSNGFTNLCIINYVFDRLNMNLPCFIEGDDSIFRTTLRNPDIGIFDRLGIDVKIQREPHVSHASFCGMIFDEDARDPLTNPINSMGRISYAGRSYLNARPKRLRHFSIPPWFELPIHLPRLSRDSSSRTLLHPIIPHHSEGM